MQIRDGRFHDSKKIAVISGNTKTFHSYVSSNNSIRVEFDSDGSVNKRGFFAYYEIYKPGCKWFHETTTSEVYTFKQ